MRLIGCLHIMLISSFFPADASTVYWTVDDDGFEDPLYPPIVNVAPHSRIWANATCGQRGEERWCKGGGPGGPGAAVGAGGRRGQQCFVCHRHHPDKAHPAELALDAGSDGWWQSPTLAEGPEFEHVSIVLDLMQVSARSWCQGPGTLGGPCRSLRVPGASPSPSRGSGYRLRLDRA